METRFWNALLNLDEAIGNVVFKGIDKDETICSYCYRRGYKIRIWFFDLVFGVDHCKSSYEDYQKRLNGVVNVDYQN